MVYTEMYIIFSIDDTYLDTYFIGTHFKFYSDMAYMVSAWFDWAIRVRRGWMGEAGVSLILNLIKVITATKCHICGYWVSIHSWICILHEQQQNLFYWELLLHKNRGGWENDDVIGSWAMSAGNSSQLAVTKENKQIK